MTTISLTLIQWDVKEPLTTTSSLSVTTLSVTTFEHVPHIHAGHHGTVTMTCHFGSRGPVYSQALAASVVLCPWARHFTCMCTLSLSRHEWVPGWAMIACVLNSSQWCDGSRAVCTPRKLSWYWNEQVPQPWKTWHEAPAAQLCTEDAIQGCCSTVPHYYYNSNC